MYALAAGCGGFRRRPFSAAPCPPLAAARVGGRARSRVPGIPPAACPRRSGCSSRRLRARGLPLRRLRRPCAPLCVSPLRSAPSLLGAGLRGAVGRPRAPPPWARASSGGGGGAPLARPLRGFARSRSPGGAPCARLRRALFLPPSPPRVWGWCCRAAARHICAVLFRRRGSFRGFARRSRAGALRALFIEQADYPQEIRRADILSNQDKKPRKLNKICIFCLISLRENTRFASRKSLIKTTILFNFRWTSSPPDTDSIS